MGVGLAVGVGGFVVSVGFTMGVGLAVGVGALAVLVGVLDARGALEEGSPDGVDDAGSVDGFGIADGCGGTEEGSGIEGAGFVASTRVSLSFFNVPVAATFCSILLVVGVTGVGSAILTSVFFVVGGFAAFAVLVVLFVAFASFATFSFLTATFFPTSPLAAFVDVDKVLVPGFLPSSTPPATPSMSSTVAFLGLPRRLGTASLVAVAEVNILPIGRLRLQKKEFRNLRIWHWRIGREKEVQGRCDAKKECGTRAKCRFDESRIFGRP